MLTDMTKLTVALHKFANVPGENKTFLIILFLTLQSINEVVKSNGPFSQFLVSGFFWIIQCWI